MPPHTPFDGGLLKVALSALEHDLHYVSGEKNTDMRTLAKTIAVAMLGVSSKYSLKLAIDQKMGDWKDKKIIARYEKLGECKFYSVPGKRQISNKQIASNRGSNSN